MDEGETLKFSVVGLDQEKVFGRERLGGPKGREDLGRLRGRECSKDGTGIQSNFMLKHVHVEKDSNVEFETLPDHPSKGNTGETVRCTVRHRPTSNI